LYLKIFILNPTAKLINITPKRITKKIFCLIKLYAVIIVKLISTRYDLVYITPCAWGLAFYKDYLVSFFVRLFHRGNVVYHFHTKGIATSKHVPKIIKKDFFKNIKVILLSPFFYYDISEFVPRDHVFYLPNGVNPAGSSLVISREHKEVNILFLSNMMKDKGVFILLEACKILKEKEVKFLCNFVGPWYDIKEKDFARFVQENKIDVYINYFGAQYGEAKEEFFKNADIFVLPTFDECFPLVILEAMAFAVPIVSTYTGAIPEIIENFKEGFLVEMNNPQALADAVEKLIVDVNLRKTMGLNALEKYKKNYTIEKFEDNFINIMNELMKRKVRKSR